MRPQVVHASDVSLNACWDVLVVGAGPAGSALAAACADLGLSTALVDRAPTRPWRHTYGAWAHELPSLPADAIAARATTVKAFALTEHRLDGEYVVLHNESLRRHLSRPDIEAITGRAESITPTRVVLADGRTIEAKLVVDASGPPRGRYVEQTAVGVTLPANILPAGEAIFMDWRQAGDPPTFCYALPLDDERVLVEETSLAHRPGLPFALLRERLHRRLAVHGWPLDRPEHERVRFPLNPPLPKGRLATSGAPRRPWGPRRPATAGATALTLAPKVARAIAETPGRVRGTIWSPAARMTHGLRRRGLSALLHLPPTGVPAFFELFFRLPAEKQRIYLTERENFTGTAAAMLALFRSAPPRLRSAIAFAATTR
ncbi:lycopene cyclase family protein [Kutzneria sp. 744]|uniref:lycopene cyclase family protein n=1 Tax=Kutzneria sp. (strain 744) TaxID=345341 RepID=UPI0003EEC2B8|nr:lycopene cyclase family protein [Kutzneria sp. 744]EWM11000.1 lycopene cyclase [Kutzneria sp. 744]